jgi:salicylate hydroxylase
MRKLRAAIAGAGLGGLYAAVALARAGAEVTVVERAEELGEAGAGIQVSPNGARALARIGVLAAVEKTAFQPEAAEMRFGLTGALVMRLPLGAAAEARWGAPYLQAHRADLLGVLEKAARKAGVTIRLGETVTGVTQDDDAAALTLASGETVGADVALAADGVRSIIREQVFGPAAPRFTGQVAWRGTVEASRLPKGLVKPTATVWVGAGRHVVTYYLRRGHLVNFVAVEERKAWADEDWWQEGDPEEMRRAFPDWDDGVTTVLGAAQSCMLWGLFDRAPPPRWSRNRIALLGDAAHPMLPFMAQGAVQAFEDGAALARLLPGADDVPAALRAYEAERRKRATRVQEGAKLNATLFHARGPVLQTLMYGPLALGSRLAPEFAMSRLDWLYGDRSAAA